MIEPSNQQPRNYKPGALQTLINVSLNSRVFVTSGDVYIPALWQAPLTDSQAKFPVVILSHGIGGNRTTYSTFCCELASHGYLVAVPEHRDGSASMTYVLQDSVRNVVELIRDQDGGKHKRQALPRSQSFKEEWRSFEHTDPMGIEWDDYNYRNSQVCN